MSSLASSSLQLFSVQLGDLLELGIEREEGLGQLFYRGAIHRIRRLAQADGEHIDAVVLQILILHSSAV